MIVPTAVPTSTRGLRQIEIFRRLLRRGSVARGIGARRALAREARGETRGHSLVSDRLVYCSYASETKLVLKFFRTKALSGLVLEYPGPSRCMLGYVSMLFTGTY